MILILIIVLTKSTKGLKTSGFYLPLFVFWYSQSRLQSHDCTVNSYDLTTCPSSVQAPYGKWPPYVEPIILIWLINMSLIAQTISGIE